MTGIHTYAVNIRMFTTQRRCAKSVTTTPRQRQLEVLQYIDKYKFKSTRLRYKMGAKDRQVKNNR